MRIVHIITTLSPGGAEHHLLSLARGQAASGHEISVVFLVGDGGLAPRFEQAGCKSVEKVSFERAGQLLSCVSGLRRELRRLRPDVVHTHLLKANALGGLAALLARIGAVVIASKHNDEVQLRRPVIARLHGWLSRLSDHRVICLSDHVADYMARIGHIRTDRISRVYYAFDPALYGGQAPVDLRAAFGLGPETMLFGMVGRVTEQKNHLDAIRAFADPRLGAIDARLVVTGREQPDYAEQVHDLVAALGLSERVIFTGWRADAYAVIGGLDCLLLPSSWEGFGLVLLEAVAQNVPVIASRVSAIPEVIQHDVHGLLVPPGDVDALADAMVKMAARHTTFRRALEQGAGPALLERFSLTAMVDGTLAVYRAARQKG